MMALRRARGALLRFVRRRPFAIVAGAALLVPARGWMERPIRRLVGRRA